MEIRNATSGEIQRAVALSQEIFDHNIRIVDLEHVRKTRQGGDVHKVKLGVHRTHKHRQGELTDYAPGCRISWTGRTVAAACWHVHGIFFDSLLTVQPKASIKVGPAWTDAPNQLIRRKGDKAVGNWRDWDAGSVFEPVKMSQLCYCTNKGLYIQRGLNRTTLAGQPYTAADIGCYIDEHWGQYATARLVEFAYNHGFSDPEIVSIALRHLESMGPSDSSQITDNEWELLQWAADDVETWLNDVWADESVIFHWYNGGFYLSLMCADFDSSEGCKREACICQMY